MARAPIEPRGACPRLGTVPRIALHQSPLWVKLRRTQYEHMFSALPSNSDIARRSRHVSKVPTRDVPQKVIAIEATVLALMRTESEPPELADYVGRLR
jgi:hypothetical protein